MLDRQDSVAECLVEGDGVGVRSSGGEGLACLSAFSLFDEIVM